MNTLSTAEPLLTIGDVIRLSIDGMPRFDGVYQIDATGQLDFPFAPSVSVLGHSRQSLQLHLENELVRIKWFHQDTVNVNLSVVRLGPAFILVSGAVFNPGGVTLNSPNLDTPEAPIQQVAGTLSTRRDLTSALSAAGGVRPDADLSAIYIQRGNNLFKVSASGILTGQSRADNIMLNDGDRVWVDSQGFENAALIRPSQITPPGMRVFMSNLTAPALTNAQSAVGADATRLPYGSSLLDAAVSANCVGGTHQANASRSVVLITKNYGSRQQIVVRRTINQLMTASSQSSVNPYVMPNDAVACYDSKFTNFRDVARGIVEVISPLILGAVL